MPVLWERPDGSLTVTTLTNDFLARERREGETMADAVDRLAKEHVQAKDPSLAGLIPVLVKSADVPADRNRRHAWRLKDGKVVVDETVPDPVNPKDALRAEVEAATTVDELKAVLGKMLA